MRPVFVTGCFRSGTTLLGSLLGMHPASLCVPEAQFKLSAMHAGAYSRKSTAAPAAYRHILNHWRFKLWDIEVDPHPALLDHTDATFRDIIEYLVSEYGRHHYDQPDPEVWIDHTPQNGKYGAALLETFDDARMIHIVRDGRAVAASVMPLDWGPNTAHEAALWWARHLSYGTALETSKYQQQGRVMRVHYEALLMDPDRTLRDICDFIGLDYHPAMSGGGGFKLPQYTVNQHSLVQGPPDVKRIDAWRRQLSDREIEIFESLVVSLLEYLDYPPVYGDTARLPTRLEMLGARLKENYFGIMVNRLRVRQRRRAAILELQTSKS